jgi:hypothetical protein
MKSPKHCIGVLYSHIFHCINQAFFFSYAFTIYNYIVRERIKDIELDEHFGKLFKRKIEDFKTWFIGLAPNLEEIAEVLIEFDIFYSFSDDIIVNRKGVAKEKSLINAMKDMGVQDTDAVFRALHKAKSK